ncbi:MAG: twin-arginine translocase subunit TatC [Pseudomonadota bacterium]
MTDKAAGEETFISHLIELRDRVIKAAFGILVTCAALFAWPGPTRLFNIVAQPMIDSLPTGSKLIATGITSSFMVPMKITLVLAIILALPWVFYQLWAFVAPGLYTHEKRLVMPLVASSSILFAGGVAFSYFFVFGRVFKFISNFAPSSISVTPDIENYLDFVMSMCLAFGAAFEVPVVVVILVRTGLVSVAKFKELRRYAIVVSVIISAIVTPPDAFSMLALAVPMCLLYELGLLVAPLFVKLTTTPKPE